MGVKLLAIASTYPPPPNPLPPGEGELLRLTVCKVSVGHETRGGWQCPPYEKPLKPFSPFCRFISFPSSCLGTHISAKLRLAIGISPPGLPAFLSKAELCIKGGSQAGAWEPENARRYVFVFRHLA